MITGSQYLKLFCHNSNCKYLEMYYYNYYYHYIILNIIILCIIYSQLPITIITTLFYTMNKFIYHVHYPSKLMVDVLKFELLSHPEQD